MINVPMIARQVLSSGQLTTQAFSKQQSPAVTQMMSQFTGMGAGPSPAPQGFGQQFGQTQTGFGSQPQPQVFSQPAQPNPMGFGVPQATPQTQAAPAFGTSPAPQQPFGASQGFSQQPVQRPAATGVILKKGQKTSLSQICPGLTQVDVGLGWDLGPNGQAYDLDVEAFMLGANGKVIGDDWFVYYNSLQSPDNSVVITKTSADGRGNGDDEIITVNLASVNQQVSKIIFVVTINEAKEHGYNFSNVQNAYVRLVNKANGAEMARFNLTDYYSNVCSMMVCELYRHNGEWKFNPIGDGTGDDLYGLCMRYGVNIAG